MMTPSHNIKTWRCADGFIYCYRATPMVRSVIPVRRSMFLPDTTDSSGNTTHSGGPISDKTNTRERQDALVVLNCTLQNSSSHHCGLTLLLA
jgi:hypothetical protein